MLHESKLLMRRVEEEVWNRGNYAVLGELVASDIVVHIQPEAVHGPDGIAQFWSAVREAFPDLHVTIEDQVAEGDKVVTRWTARATHQGEFQGIPPTGNHVCVTGIDIDRIANGKNVEGWSTMDELGLLHQLDALPAPEPGTH